MTRCFLAAIFLALFASSYSAADDYLLRLETVDLRVLPNGDKEVNEGTPESIEIVVRDVREERDELFAKRDPLYVLRGLTEMALLKRVGARRGLNVLGFLRQQSLKQLR